MLEASLDNVSRCCSCTKLLICLNKSSLFVGAFVELEVEFGGLLEPATPVKSTIVYCVVSAVLACSLDVVSLAVPPNKLAPAFSLIAGDSFFSGPAICRISLRCPNGIFGETISTITTSDKASRLLKPRFKSSSIADFVILFCRS